MDETVRSEHGWPPRESTVARLAGFELRIDPLSRLVPRPGASAYGVVCSATGEELDHIYSSPWMEHYRPRGVIVELSSGGSRDVTVYVPSGPIDDATVPAGYVERLLEIARQHAFPEWYCAQIARTLGER